MGIPPANRAPNCGGPAPPPEDPEDDCTDGGAANPPPPDGPFFEPSRAGADLSLVTAFFNARPACICASSAEFAIWYAAVVVVYVESNDVYEVSPRKRGRPLFGTRHEHRI